MITKTVVFIACHAGPADHFAAFAENLSKEQGVDVAIFASGPAWDKVKARSIQNVTPFELENLSEEEQKALAKVMAKACAVASHVITDIGADFDVKLQESMAKHAKEVVHYIYYDNPEAYVPGAYSAVAARVLRANPNASVLFANTNLATSTIYEAPGKEIDLGNRRKIALGYYPVEKAQEIFERRASKDVGIVREKIFIANGLEDKGQRILAYFGGGATNKAYLEQALPAFLDMVSEGIRTKDLSDEVILFQQHPTAKLSKADEPLILEWIEKNGGNERTPKIMLSTVSSDEAQVVASAALYYQTSMSAQFVLAGIPTLQIGHEMFDEVLTREKLIPCVTHAENLIQELAALGQNIEIDREIILKGLGIKKDWPQTLRSLLN